MGRLHGRRCWVACVVVWLCACLAGCGSGDDGLVDGFGGLIDESFTLVEGVEVCVFEREDIPCATTSNLGTYQIRLPVGRSYLTYRKAGYQSRLRAVLVEEGPFDLGSVEGILTEAYMARQADRLGFALDPAAGVLVLGVSGPARGGAQMVAEPLMGEGPYYNGHDLEFDPDLTATVAAQLTAGAVFNAPVGIYDVGIVHPDAECTVGRYAFPGSDENVAGPLVIADHMVIAGFRCE
jgi:hypothetical protein